MNIKYILLILVVILLTACVKEDKLIVKDLKNTDINIKELKKPKIIIFLNNFACHDCLMNLDAFISSNYILDNYNYNIIYEDSKIISDRRITQELYLKYFTLGVQNIYFLSENSIDQKKLNITCKIFQQLTPYVVFIDSNNKAVYYSYKKIFNDDGTVKSSFKI
jgi:hypothetical protein